MLGGTKNKNVGSMKMSFLKEKNINKIFKLLKPLQNDNDPKLAVRQAFQKSPQQREFQM